jgi:hypothetical protein
MSAVEKVKTRIAEYIQETLDKDDLNERKIELIRLFLEHCGTPAERRRRIGQANEDGEDKDKAGEREAFPTEGLVSGKQAAKFLGYGDMKNPAGVVRRLAGEGKIPAPVRGRNNTFLWYARDIREYAEKIEGAA